MKLTKKLLPLAFVATTAAAIVPMTVSCSCSKDKGEIKVEDLQDFFEKGTYERQTQALAKQDVTVDQETGKSTQATDAYFDALKDNPKYLADDIWSFLAQIDTTSNPEPTPEFHLPFKIEGSMGISTESNKTDKTIDLKLTCDVKISEIVIDEDENGDYDFLKDAIIEAKGSLWAKGFKFGVKYYAEYESKQIWFPYLDYTASTDTQLSPFWKDTKWEIGADLNVKVGGYDDAGANASFNIALNSTSDLVKLAIEKKIHKGIETLFNGIPMPLGTLENFKPKA